MNLVSIFYTIRFLFYLILPEKYRFFPDAGTILMQMDIFLSSVAGIIIAGTFASSKINPQRAKKLLLIPPIILVSPAFFILPFFVINRQWQDLIESVISISDLLFFIFSISFSLLLPYLIMGSFKSSKQVFLYSTGMLIIGLISIAWIKPDNVIFGFVHNAPFILASLLVNKKIIKV